MVRLVVAEKPSVARDLARILGAKSKHPDSYRGDQYWVTWCLGHMVELCEPQAYKATWKRWSPGLLPMLPEEFKLQPIKRSGGDHWPKLKHLVNAKPVEEVINACDAGREGELIFRLVYELAGCTKPVLRLWLSSLTDQAIKQGLKSMKPGTDFDPLADAAKCRSEADWLVGMNATRAMTLQNRRAGGEFGVMSVGRVQTPTLAMIVEREREIVEFKPEPFWQIYAHFKAEAGVYEGKWTRGKVDRLLKEEEAKAVLDAVKDGKGEVVKAGGKEVKEKPPLLHDLTQLQRLANQKYGLSAADTLAVAQALYEKHKLLTYPRTDSNYLTTDMAKGLPAVLRGISIPPYDRFCQALLNALPLKTSKRIINDKEVGDHHAIIPTGKKPDFERLSENERRIFDLVTRRFIAAFCPDAVFATARIETKVEGHLFVTRGRVRKRAGWQEVEPPMKDAKKNAAKGKGKKQPTAPDLPNVKKGDAVETEKARMHKGMTKPPKRYNEGTLLRSMELAGKELDDAAMRRVMKDSGIGTPATRAAIIETLLRRDYIKRAGKNLVPTEQGKKLINSLAVDVLKSASLTGDWEKKLSEVARGKYSRAQFMQEVRNFTAGTVKGIFSALRGEDGNSAPLILGTCPLCKANVTEHFKTYKCDTGKECSFVIFKTVAKKEITPDLVQVMLKGETTQPVHGFKSKKGKDFSASLKLNEEGRTEFVFQNNRASGPRPPQHSSEENPGKTTCPSCKEGVILQGKKGWGCSRWKAGCRFVVWFEQSGRTIPATEARLLMNEGKTGVLNGFETPEGEKIRGRLILDLDQKGFVRFEEVSRNE